MRGLKIHDDGRGEEAGERLKQDRASRDARTLANLFLLESMFKPPQERLKRAKAMHNLLWDMLAGGASGSEQYEAVQTLRAEWEKAGTIGA